jgi:hypothetical protein
MWAVNIVRAVWLVALAALAAVSVRLRSSLRAAVRR